MRQKERKRKKQKEREERGLKNRSNLEEGGERKVM